MSCVCAIVKDGNVFMAADSIGVADTYIAQRADPKIFRNGEHLFGYAGNVRCGQVLYPNFFTPPKDIYELPDAIREQYKEKGCLSVSDTGADRFESLLLVGFQGKIYYIMADFQLGENSEDFLACGSGQSYALAILYHTMNIKDPNKRLEKAVKAASYFCTEVGGEIQFEYLEGK